MVSLLEFYKQNEVSPVKQDIDDIQKHFNRREALYHHLGIPPITIQNKKVIEVGPGSGHNSLYTASLKPEKLVLVEPNPKGAEEINELYNKYPEYKKYIKIIPKKIEDFDFAEGGEKDMTLYFVKDSSAVQELKALKN